MSHASSIKAQYQYNKKNVMYLCGITEDDYGKFQMDTSIEWLEKYWSSIIDIDAVMNTRLFWSWFASAWSEADDRFILEQLYSSPKPSRWCLYRQLHQYLFDDNDHHQIMMQKDFRAMEKEFKREIKKPELYAVPTTLRNAYCSQLPMNTLIKFK